MSRYRGRLPQLDGGLFLSDGGIETTLIFHEGIELPHFAAFALLRTAAGRQTLRSYYERHIAIARAQASDSFWRARPGGRALTGARGSAIRAMVQAVGQGVGRGASTKPPMNASGSTPGCPPRRAAGASQLRSQPFEPHQMGDHAQLVLLLRPQLLEEGDERRLQVLDGSWIEGRRLAVQGLARATPSDRA
jgi:hypothetical protein